MSQSQPPASKLFVRSEVLAVIDFMNTMDEPSKLDKIKQFKRLQAINDATTVQTILVKELQRASSTRIIQIISELLMELGNIETLQSPLWAIIQSPQSSDDIKDAANMILRQLGDETDPNLYLEYLDDPAGLINRETERMLEVSTRNPEALIDFIDFIFSLPVDEQCNLIRSLQSDYPAEYLLNIFIPAILALPPYDSLELLLSILGDMRTSRTAVFFKDYQDWFQHDPRLAKAIKKSINSLKIAGLYRDERLAEAREELAQPHPLVLQTKLYQCFATIPDGIGNQGIVISRERDNGDVVMMSVAINDLHGIIDCFGFYELSKADFHKLIEKFHEENTKIHTPLAYCIQKLREAEALNYKNKFRLPYEYSCWKVLLSDPEATAESSLDLPILCKQWANQDWESASVSLYQHPDFSTWFLEEGDHPVVTAILEDVLELCAKTLANVDDDEKPMKLKQLESAFIETLDKLADAMVHGLLSTEWRGILTNRLADAAYLLHEQKATTFASLAATEVQKLLAYEGFDTPLGGFIKHYGRRCIEEDLLRLKQGAQTSTELQDTETFERLIDTVLTTWEL
jgi:hypothetical protein